MFDCINSYLKWFDLGDLTEAQLSKVLALRDITPFIENGTLNDETTGSFTIRDGCLRVPSS